MDERLILLYKELEFFLNNAPCEDDCTKEENQVYSDMANLKSSMEDIGIKSNYAEEKEAKATDNIFKKKKEIIDMFSAVLKEANSSIEKAELTKIKDMDIVIVTVKDGAQYKINVDADSYSAMLYDVINVMRYK